MSEHIFQVDAFAEAAFGGNPAAVVLLRQAKDAAWMQSVAAEMALSETAFVSATGQAGTYEIRWFTPTVEAALCGHATLAAAHVLWESGAVNEEVRLQFLSRGGPLAAEKSASGITLDFPSEPVEALASTPRPLLEEFGGKIRFVGQNRLDYFIELSDETDVRGHRPDFARLAELRRGVIITAQSDDGKFDFVSRVFAPSEGIDEDPVTGSAHCALAPYWARRLGKEVFRAFQASKRGGVVRAHFRGERTHLSGRAVTVLRGQLLV